MKWSVIVFIILGVLLLNSIPVSADTDTKIEEYPNWEGFSNPLKMLPRTEFDFTQMSMEEVQQYWGVAEHHSSSRGNGAKYKLTSEGLQVYSSAYRGGAMLYSKFSIPPQVMYGGFVIETVFKLQPGWTKCFHSFPQLVHPYNPKNGKSILNGENYGYSPGLVYLYGGYGDGYRNAGMSYYDPITSTSWKFHSMGFHPSDGGTYCTRTIYYPDKIIMEYYNANCDTLLKRKEFDVPTQYIGKYFDYYANNGYKEYPGNKLDLRIVMSVYDDYKKKGFIVKRIRLYLEGFDSEQGGVYGFKHLVKLFKPDPVISTLRNPSVLHDNYGNVGNNIPTVNLCGETAYGVLGNNEYLEIQPGLPDGDYLIEIRGFSIDSMDSVNGKYSSSYGDSLTLFINNKIIQWLPIDHDMSTISTLKWMYDSSFEPQNCYGHSDWTEKAFKVYAYYHGPINTIKLLEHQDEGEDNEGVAIQHVKIYKISLEKVYESDDQFTGFETHDESGNTNNKITYISETGENVLGGGSGFGKGSYIKLSQELPVGAYLIRFNYYFFDSWDGGRYLNEGGILYINNDVEWGLIMNHYDYSSSYGHYPYSWLKNNGFIKELSTNYFSSSWNDRYVTANVFYYGEIKELKWTQGLNSDGSDESFGIGKVEIYKITSFRVVDIASDIFIPLDKEVTDNPKPIKSQLYKLITENDYAEVRYVGYSEEMANANWGITTLGYLVTGGDNPTPRMIVDFTNTPSGVEVALVSTQHTTSDVVNFVQQDGHTIYVINLDPDNEGTLKNIVFKIFSNGDSKGYLIIKPKQYTTITLPSIQYTDWEEDMTLDYDFESSHPALVESRVPLSDSSTPSWVTIGVDVSSQNQQILQIDDWNIDMENKELVIHSRVNPSYLSDLNSEGILQVKFKLSYNGIPIEEIDVSDDAYNNIINPMYSLIYWNKYNITFNSCSVKEVVRNVNTGEEYALVEVTGTMRLLETSPSAYGVLDFYSGNGEKGGYTISKVMAGTSFTPGGYHDSIMYPAGLGEYKFKFYDYLPISGPGDVITVQNNKAWTSQQITCQVGEYSEVIDYDYSWSIEQTGTNTFTVTYTPPSNAVSINQLLSEIGQAITLENGDITQLLNNFYTNMMYPPSIIIKTDEEQIQVNSIKEFLNYISQHSNENIQLLLNNDSGDEISTNWYTVSDVNVTKINEILQDIEGKLIIYNKYFHSPTEMYPGVISLRIETVNINVEVQDYQNFNTVIQSYGSSKDYRFMLLDGTQPASAVIKIVPSDLFLGEKTTTIYTWTYNSVTSEPLLMQNAMWSLQYTGYELSGSEDLTYKAIEDMNIDAEIVDYYVSVRKYFEDTPSYGGGMIGGGGGKESSEIKYYNALVRIHGTINVLGQGPYNVYFGLKVNGMYGETTQCLTLNQGVNTIDYIIRGGEIFEEDLPATGTLYLETGANRYEIKDVTLTIPEYRDPLYEISVNKYADDIIEITYTPLDTQGLDPDNCITPQEVLQQLDSAVTYAENTPSTFLDVLHDGFYLKIITQNGPIHTNDFRVLIQEILNGAQEIHALLYGSDYTILLSGYSESALTDLLNTLNTKKISTSEFNVQISFYPESSVQFDYYHTTSPIHAENIESSNMEIGQKYVGRAHAGGMAPPSDDNPDDNIIESFPVRITVTDPTQPAYIRFRIWRTTPQVVNVIADLLSQTRYMRVPLTTYNLGQDEVTVMYQDITTLTGDPTSLSSGDSYIQTEYGVIYNIDLTTHYGIYPENVKSNGDVKGILDNDNGFFIGAYVSNDGHVIAQYMPYSDSVELGDGTTLTTENTPVFNEGVDCQYTVTEDQDTGDTIITLQVNSNNIGDFKLLVYSYSPLSAGMLSVKVDGVDVTSDIDFVTANSWHNPVYGFILDVPSTATTIEFTIYANTLNGHISFTPLWNYQETLSDTEILYVMYKEPTSSTITFYNVPIIGQIFSTEVGSEEET